MILNRRRIAISTAGLIAASSCAAGITLEMSTSAHANVPPTTQIIKGYTAYDNLNKTAVATCPAGTAVTGSGFDRSGTSVEITRQIIINNSVWVSGTSPNNTPFELVAYAACLS